MYDNFLLHFLPTNKYFPLEKGEVVIAGKSRDHSSLYLVPYFKGPITTISRRHFQLSYNHRGLFIEDLGSKNGTEVNGQALLPKNRRRLVHGNTIRIAKNDDFLIQIIDENSGTDVIDEPQSKPPMIPRHGVYFHEDENIFYLNGQAIHGLGPRGMEVLKYLYQYKKEELSYYQILRDVFSPDNTKDSVRAAVKSIRNKFEEMLPGSRMRYLKTVHGFGYKLVTE